MKAVKEGWHTVYGIEVHVNEKGFIDKTMKKDPYVFGGWTIGHIYRKCKREGWDRDDECTLNAFRAAAKRGTIQIF